MRRTSMVGNVTDGGRYSAAPGESRDCSVRATAVALDIPYHIAHAMFEREGREPQRRTKLGVSDRVLKGYRSHRYTRKRPTLARFIREHPEGRYIVRIRGHMFAVIDGGVHDMLPWPSPCSLVLQYWKVR